MKKKFFATAILLCLCAAVLPAQAESQTGQAKSQAEQAELDEHMEQAIQAALDKLAEQSALAKLAAQDEQAGGFTIDTSNASQARMLREGSFIMMEYVDMPPPEMVQLTLSLIFENNSCSKITC